MLRYRAPPPARKISLRHARPPHPGPRAVVRSTAAGLGHLAFAVLPLVWYGSALGAQGRTTDAGVALVTFTDDDAVIAGPYLRAARAGASGSVRWLGDGTLIATVGAVSGSATVGGAWRRPLGRVALEVDAEGSALFGSAARPGRSVLAGVKAERRVGTAGGVWLRGGGHLAWRESGPLTGHVLDAGAWWTAEPRLLLGGRIQRTVAEGQLFADGTRDRVLAIVPVRHTEASVSALLRSAWGELQVGGGVRHDRDALQRLEPRWSLASTIRTSDRASILLAAARESSDYARGSDGATSVSLGMRWATAQLPADRPRRPPAAGQVVAVVEATGALRVTAPGASTVEVMATFTDWSPVILVRAGTDFRLDRAIPVGLHRMAVRVDGGPWRAPANTPSIDDEFGGRVGLIVVP